LKKILLVVVCALVFVSCQKNIDILNKNPDKQIELLDFTFNDSFAGFEIQSLDGKVMSELPQNSDHQIVFYLSDRCGTCIEMLRMIHRFESLYCSEKLDYVIYWEDVIPENLLDKNLISREKNFSLQGKYKLNSITPTYFMINSDKKLEFLANDFELIIKKILSDQINSQELMIENANNYIKSQIIENTSDKLDLIYFSMTGCPDCVAAEDVLNSGPVKDAFEISTIYSKNELDDKKYIDKYNMFLNIYGIDWYPSFLVLDKDGEYELIGKTSVEKLQDALLKYAN